MTDVDDIARDLDGALDREEDAAPSPPVGQAPEQTLTDEQKQRLDRLLYAVDGKPAAPQAPDEQEREDRQERWPTEAADREYVATTLTDALHATYLHGSKGAVAKAAHAAASAFAEVEYLDQQIDRLRKQYAAYQKAAALDLADGKAAMNENARLRAELEAADRKIGRVKSVLGVRFVNEITSDQFQERWRCAPERTEEEG